MTVKLSVEANEDALTNDAPSYGITVTYVKDGYVLYGNDDDVMQFLDDFNQHWFVEAADDE